MPRMQQANVTASKGKTMKKLLLFFLALLIPVYAHAATYYVSPTGSDSGTGATGSPWATLSKAFSTMAGGDTLICKDGTYTGDSNRITIGGSSTISPPRGTTGAYTIVKAEHDGLAIFDGQNARNMFDVEYFSGLTAQYWQFEGIIWCNSPGTTVLLTYSSYVKFLRCGAYDAGTGNVVNFAASRGCDYILFENCYAYGQGRYKFIGYQASHIIFRQCVGRLDREDAGGEVLAIFSMYSVSYGEVQNCIAIDSDQTQAWSNYADLAGGFAVPATDMDANNINFVQSVALNNRLGGVTTAGTEYYRAANVHFTNCTIWAYPSVNPGNAVNNLRGLNDYVDHCTFGISGQNSAGVYSFNSYNRLAGGVPNNSTIRNTVLYNHTGGTLFYDIENYDYNDLYNNTNGPTPAAHDIAVNPIYNASTNPTGGLKYITQVEAGSNLAGHGSGGSDIGANIKTLVGVSGTLWGQSGYATDTGVSMWPFPNQDLIRTAMKAYNAGGVSGNRGFCADGVNLTGYIQNYLSNGQPTYQNGTAIVITTGSLPDGTQNTAYNQSITSNIPGNWSVQSGILPTGTSLTNTVNTTVCYLNGTPTVPGSSSFIIRANNTANLTQWANHSFTVSINPPLNFPTTSIIDNANRADSPNLGSNWVNITPGLRISGNTIHSTTADTAEVAYFNTTYGADQEVYMTIANQGALSRGGIEFRVNTTPTVTGYAINFDSDSQLLLFRRYDSGSSVILDTSAWTPVNGDSIGFRMVGNNATSFYKPAGGAWIILGTDVDTTYNRPGYIAVWLLGNTSTALDDIGGGSYNPGGNITILTTAIANGTVGSYYNQSLTANLVGNWTVQSGSLPVNTTLVNVNNTLTSYIVGYPSTAGSASFVIQVNNTISSDNQSYSYAVNVGATDTTPPAAITNLAASTGTYAGQINLQWTAPGDDGNTGTAQSYSLRYSTSPITNNTTYNAAPPLPGVPAPLAAGTVQVYTASGLVNATTYYFAIKAWDAAGNVAGLSNTANATSGATESGAPATSGRYSIRIQ